MIGPVLSLELLTGGRRQRNLLLRWGYAGWLTLQFEVLLFGFGATSLYAGERDSLLTEACQNYVAILVHQQFILLLLVVPGLLAGAVTDEKTRGTLQYLLTTDLTVGEILLGKLVARAGWLGTVALLPLPFLCLVAPFAGLDLLGLLTLAVTNAVLIFSLGAVGLLASVWGRKTSGAVIGLYCCLGIGYGVLQLLAGYWAWLRDQLHWLDPMYPLDLGESPGGLRGRGVRLLAWVVPWLVLGLAAFGLAVWRMLPAYFRQLESLGRKRRFWWEARRPPVRGNPVAWKERYVEGLAPLSFLRALPTWLAVVGVFLLTALAYGSMMLYHLNFDALFDFDPVEDEPGSLFERVWRLEIPTEEFAWRSVVVLLLTVLLVGIRCSGSVTGERERQTWESLLLTPLETRLLIRGKFWGILGSTYPYLLAYAVPALAFSILGGWNAILLTLLFLGVTWLAMAYVGGAGIWASAGSKSSWHSLLVTLVAAYVGGSVLYLLGSAFVMILAIFLTLVLANVFQWLGGPALPFTGAMPFPDPRVLVVAICVVLAVAFGLAAWQFVVAAEQRINRKERIKHWRAEEEQEFVRSRYRRRRRSRT